MDNNRKTAEKGAVAVKSTDTETSTDIEKSNVPQNSVKDKNESGSGEAKGSAKPLEETASNAKAVETLQDPDELIKPLKELLTALEKRQKVIQEMGDYRNVLQSLVSGELLSGEDLDRAKQVIQSLGKLVKATLDHQKALTTASDIMPALDKILAVKKAS